MLEELNPDLQDLAGDNTHFEEACPQAIWHRIHNEAPEAFQKVHRNRGAHTSGPCRGGYITNRLETPSLLQLVSPHTMNCHKPVEPHNYNCCHPTCVNNGHVKVDGGYSLCQPNQHSEVQINSRAVRTFCPELGNGVTASQDTHVNTIQGFSEKPRQYARPRTPKLSKGAISENCKGVRN